MDEVEVPAYFMCPISLQIMKDPVTTVTGITYDRESIEGLLSPESHGGGDRNTTGVTCPLTKQSLPVDSDLTPNHTLRRLIQSWCVTGGVDRNILTSKPVLVRRHAVKLAAEVLVASEVWDEFRQVLTVKKIEGLAKESQWNREILADGGLVKALAVFVVRSFKEGTMVGVEEALRTLHLIWVPNGIDNHIVFLESLAWILGFKEAETDRTGAKSEAIKVLKLVIGEADSDRLERLRLELFMNITMSLREMRSSPNRHQYSSSLKLALQTLIQACPWGRNRAKIVESGTVFELVEMELIPGLLDRDATELVFSILAHLCACSDGRAQLVGHAGGIAMVARRILRISAKTDEHALHVLSQIAGFSAKSKVLAEMLTAGAAAKLCMVMQTDYCEGRLKEKARRILKLHSGVWSDSPCVGLYLMSRTR